MVVAQSGFTVQSWRGLWEGGVFLMLWKISISSLLHSPRVSWKAAQSIFRHVWTGLNAVCLLCLLVLLPSHSLPLSWLGSLKRRPNINICHWNGKEEINLSLPPHHSSQFSLSIACLFRGYSLFFWIIPPSLPSTHLPTLSRKEFLPSLFTSLTPLFSAFCEWLLTPPSWLASVRAAYPRWHFSVHPPFSNNDRGLLELIGLFD